MGGKGREEGRGGRERKGKGCVMAFWGDGRPWAQLCPKSITHVSSSLSRKYQLVRDVSNSANKAVTSLQQLVFVEELFTITKQCSWLPKLIPYHLLVVLFNFYFTLYGASELRMGATANAHDMMRRRCNGIWEMMTRLLRHNRHNGLLPALTCYRLVVACCGRAIWGSRQLVTWNLV